MTRFITFDDNYMVLMGAITRGDVGTLNFDNNAPPALERLQMLLCDDTLTMDRLPALLAPLLSDLIIWQWQHKPSETGIKSERTENYSYTKADETEVNSIILLRKQYGDIIRQFSKCEHADGETTSASHLPLYTPDYYRERNPYL